MTALLMVSLGAPPAAPQGQEEEVKLDRLSPGLEALVRSSDGAPRREFPFPAKGVEAPPDYLPDVMTVIVEEPGRDQVKAVRAVLEGAKIRVLSEAPEAGTLTVVVRNRSDLAAVAAADHVVYVERSSQRHASPHSSSTWLNARAQDAHQVKKLRTGHGVDGTGVHVGIWDLGAVYVKHTEFKPRATQRDEASKLGAHATHVSGTIGAEGAVDPLAQGMAPSVILECYDSWKDTLELPLAVKDLGVVCSNHSYGFPRGWTYNYEFLHWEWHGNPKVDKAEDHLFGMYNSVSLAFDRIVEGAPGLSVFVAAGNDRLRDDADPYSLIPGWDGYHYVVATRTWSTDTRKADDWDDGYDTLEGAALSKNVITVGAMQYPTPDQPTILPTKFTSFGPPDDGRVKPDVVASGFVLWSTTFTYDMSGNPVDAYGVLSGTSQSTPVATGTGALLNQLANAKLKRTLFADEMKALLTHTADSPNEGPSYQIGWGGIRADLAGDLLAGTSGRLLRDEVGNLSVTCTRTAAKNVRVTLVWIDPAIPPRAKRIDDRTPQLAYDFDLAVIDPLQTRYEPWLLNPNKPAAAAVRGPNHVDNMERIDVPQANVDGATPGDWKIEVKYPAKAKKWRAALAITGLEPK